LFYNSAADSSRESAKHREWPYLFYDSPANPSRESAKHREWPYLLYDSPAKNTVYTPYIHDIWFWPALSTTHLCVGEEVDPPTTQDRLHLWADSFAFCVGERAQFWLEVRHIDVWICIEVVTAFICGPTPLLSAMSQTHCRFYMCFLCGFICVFLYVF